MVCSRMSVFRASCRITKYTCEAWGSFSGLPALQIDKVCSGASAPVQLLSFHFLRTGGGCLPSRKGLPGRKTRKSQTNIHEEVNLWPLEAWKRQVVPIKQQIAHRIRTRHHGVIMQRAGTRRGSEPTGSHEKRAQSNRKVLVTLASACKPVHQTLSQTGVSAHHVAAAVPLCAVSMRHCRAVFRTARRHAMVVPVPLALFRSKRVGQFLLSSSCNVRAATTTGAIPAAVGKLGAWHDLTSVCAPVAWWVFHYQTSKVDAWHGVLRDGPSLRMRPFTPKPDSFNKFNLRGESSRTKQIVVVLRPESCAQGPVTAIDQQCRIILMLAQGLQRTLTGNSTSISMTKSLWHSGCTCGSWADGLKVSTCRAPKPLYHPRR